MATLQDLITRFKQAETTDETAVLTPEELADPKTKSLADIAKQSVRAEQQSQKLELTKQQEEEEKQRQAQAAKEKTAAAFGLTPEEKARYIAPPKSPLASMPMPAAPSTAPQPTETAPTAPIERKQTETTPPASLKGGAEPSPAVTDTTGAAPGEQPEKPATISPVADAINDTQKIADSLGANRPTDRSQLEGLLAKLDAIKPDTDTYKDPIVRDFLADKAEIFRAYKEKADRNEWLDLAQNLVNSLTQFASAQAAVGTGRVGGGLPLPRTDYGARTEQAFREYRAQAADIGEEQKYGLAEQERIDRLRKEKMAGERATLGEKIAAERENIRQQEADAKQAGRDAISLYGILQTNKRADEATQMQVQRAILQYQSHQDKAAASELDKQMKARQDDLKKYQDQLKATNTLIQSDSKQYDKNLAGWATAIGRDAEELVSQADKESPWYTRTKTYIKETMAPQQAQDLSRLIETAKQDLVTLRAARSQTGATPPGQPVPAPAPAITPAPSTTPPAGGKVTLRDPVSGQTRQVVWDAAAQAKVNAGKLEIVK